MKHKELEFEELLALLLDGSISKRERKRLLRMIVEDREKAEFALSVLRSFDREKELIESIEKEIATSYPIKRKRKLSGMTRKLALGSSLITVSLIVIVSLISLTNHKPSETGRHSMPHKGIVLTGSTHIEPLIPDSSDTTPDTVDSAPMRNFEKNRWRVPR